MNSLQKKEYEAITFLRNNKTKTTYVSFSGGKDSLVALDLAIRAGIKKAVFSDTTIEFPQTLKYIDEIKNFYQIKLDKVKAPKNFFEVVSNVGFPSRRLRWCCEVFKFGPLGLYAKKNKIGGFVTGLRKEESRRRAKYTSIDINPGLQIKQLNPILDWKEEEIWDYITKYKLPYNPLYKYYSRVGCWCCPYRSKNDWDITASKFPDLIEILRKELYRFSTTQNIPDLKEFIDNHGWTAWASPFQRTTIGTISPCQKKAGSKSIVLYGKDKKEVQKVSHFIRLLTKDYKIIGEGIRVTIDKKYERSIKICVEKSLNCIGCGACLQLCDKGALILKSGKIDIQTSKCTRCKKCISSKYLRGGCIARNYSYDRRAILSTE